VNVVIRRRAVFMGLVALAAAGFAVAYGWRAVAQDSDTALLLACLLGLVAVGPFVLVAEGAGELCEIRAAALHGDGDLVRLPRVAQIGEAPQLDALARADCPVDLG